MTRYQDIHNDGQALAAPLRARGAAPADPWVVVVVPAYKQAQYLKDAVLSAVRQSMRDRTRVVIVNDGCPYPATDWMGRYLRDAFPGEVYYLRKCNGGVSAARNHG